MKISSTSMVTVFRHTTVDRCGTPMRSALQPWPKPLSGLAGRCHPYSNASRRAAEHSQPIARSWLMPEAVIVSAARTPIGRAYRGAFNQTHGATLAGHVVKHAAERAGVDPAEVEDVILGVGLPEGATGHNLGRNAALRAGFPQRVPGTTINRYCGSGLQAISTAAGRIVSDGAKVIVAGGCESISMVQNDLHMKGFTEEWLLRHTPDIFMPMLQTADNVAKHYKISRETQDEYSFQSQQRTAAAQA